MFGPKNSFRQILTWRYKTRVISCLECDEFHNIETSSMQGETGEIQKTRCLRAALWPGVPLTPPCTPTWSTCVGLGVITCVLSQFLVPWVGLDLSKPVRRVVRLPWPCLFTNKYHQYLCTALTFANLARTAKLYNSTGQQPVHLNFKVSFEDFEGAQDQTK